MKKKVAKIEWVRGLRALQDRFGHPTTDTDRRLKDIKSGNGVRRKSKGQK